MPKGKTNNTRKIIKKPRKEVSQETFNGTSESIASEDSLKIPHSPVLSGSEKTVMENNSDEVCPQEFSGEMAQLLERFNSDLNKTVQAKRKKLEKFTQESTRAITRKVLETTESQSLERRKLLQHFQEKFLTIIQQGESELEKIKDTEEIMHKLLLQQHKQKHQVIVAHSERVNALKNLSEEFCRGMSELEESHVEQYSTVHNELRKEIAQLQRKM